MIFSTWQFAVFFTIVFAAYWSLRGRHSRHALLLVASYVFYMAWNAKLVLIVIGLTLFDHAVGLLLDRTRIEARRRMLLIASLCANLGVLAIFKYADFFILSMRDLLAGFGVHTGWHTLGILLPVGISFHTFQTMSYTIDVYRRRIAPCRSLVDFALFVAFFPQLVAGPIVRASDFLPELNDDKRFDWRRLESGVVLFMVGLTKKLLIADQLATLVDPVFANPHVYSTRDLWLATFCYGGQIFCDFSGYTDMAIATARVLGFDFAENFASPYLATSLTAFWRRWHISLSQWLRDYLFIPLGGSRFSQWNTCRNLMTTMLLGGLWHGASWSFVIWGSIHGLVLCAEKLWRAAFAKKSHTHWLASLNGWVATILIVHLAWVFFRCQPTIAAGSLEPEPTSVALSRAGYIVTHLFVPAQIDRPVWIMNKLPMLCLLALMGIMQLYEEWIRRGRPNLHLPAPIAGLSYAAWIAALVVFSSDNVNPFIYFQF